MKYRIRTPKEIVTKLTIYHLNFMNPNLSVNQLTDFHKTAIPSSLENNKNKKLRKRMFLIHQTL